MQLTNSERSFHKSKHHMMWYLSVTVSVSIIHFHLDSPLLALFVNFFQYWQRQILGYPKLAEDDLMKMCDSYFGETNFTADIRHCSWVRFQCSTKLIDLQIKIILRFELVMNHDLLTCDCRYTYQQMIEGPIGFASR